MSKDIDPNWKPSTLEELRDWFAMVDSNLINHFNNTFLMVTPTVPQQLELMARRQNLMGMTVMRALEIQGGLVKIDEANVPKIVIN